MLYVTHMILFYEQTLRRRPPTSGVVPAARRTIKKPQVRASSRTNIPRRDAASIQARKANVSTSPHGWMRAANTSSTTAALSGGLPRSRGGPEDGYQDYSEPVLELVGVMEDMQADIASLKTKVVSLNASKNQQAKELVI